MSVKLTEWELQPQEQEGEYMFSGTSYMTRGINEALHPLEVVQIVAKVKERVEANNGADYLQVFKDGTGRKIFVIDQLNRKMKAENPAEWVKENDIFTILFAEEY
jgi:hypothetical protein